MQRLQDKIAVITGASSGIGAGIAAAFAKEGARVIVNYLKSADKAGQIVRRLQQGGGRAVARQADVADKEALDALIRYVLAEFGQIDIWVNNAGADILTGRNATLTDRQKLERLIEVDLKGAIAACRAIAPIMQKQGRGSIINMGWDLSIHGLAGANPQSFAAVKAGILGFTRSFAKTAGPAPRVNLLAPGWIQTAFAEEYMDAAYYQARVEEIPLGRFGKPEDVAAAAVFLASDEASYITGEAIKINGGLI